MTRFLVLLFALVATTAFAQTKGTPTFGVDRTGTDRTVCVFQPTPGGPCINMGSYNTGTASWSTPPNVTIPGGTFTAPLNGNAPSDLGVTPTTGCTTSSMGAQSCTATGQFNWTSKWPVSVGESNLLVNGNITTGRFTSWSASHAYAAGAYVANHEVGNPNIYVNRGACTSGAASEPTGTGNGHVDGTCTWDWSQTVNGVAKVNLNVATAVNGPNAGNLTWGIYNSMHINSMPSDPTFWAGMEIAILNQGRDCVVAVDSCHGLLIDGFMDKRGSSAVTVSMQTSSGAGWLTGLSLLEHTASSADIMINDAAQYGIVLNAFSSSANIHSVAAIADFSPAGTPIGILLGGSYDNWAVQANGPVFAKLLTVGNLATGGTATPSQISMDTSSSNTAGANPKLNLFGNSNGTNVYGLGVASDGLDYLAMASASHNFYVNGTRVLYANTGGIGVGFGTTSTATPTQIAMDTSSSNTAGSNPKLNLWGNTTGANNFGLGVSTNSFDLMARSGAAYNFYVNGTKVLNVGTAGTTVGNATGSTATPTQLAVDTTSSSTPGSNPKISLFGVQTGSNAHGFGLSGFGVDYMTQAGSAHNFWVNGTRYLYITSSNTVINNTVDFHQAAVGSTCTVTDSINVLVNGVAKKIPIC